MLSFISLLETGVCVIRGSVSYISDTFDYCYRFGCLHWVRADWNEGCRIFCLVSTRVVLPLIKMRFAFFLTFLPVWLPWSSGSTRISISNILCSQLGWIIMVLIHVYSIEISQGYENNFPIRRILCFVITLVKGGPGLADAGSWWRRGMRVPSSWDCRREWAGQARNQAICSSLVASRACVCAILKAKALSSAAAHLSVIKNLHLLSEISTIEGCQAKVLLLLTTVSSRMARCAWAIAGHPFSFLLLIFVNGRKEVSFGDGKVLLSRLGDQVHATSAFCTHYGAPLAKGVLTADGRVVW